MDGIIIVNKPKNCTSHDIVQKARKIFREKVGSVAIINRQRNVMFKISNES